MRPKFETAVMLEPSSVWADPGSATLIGVTAGQLIEVTVVLNFS